MNCGAIAFDIVEGSVRSHVVFSGAACLDILLTNDLTELLLFRSEAVPGTKLKSPPSPSSTEGSRTKRRRKLNDYPGYVVPTVPNTNRSAPTTILSLVVVPVLALAVLTVTPMESPTTVFHPKLCEVDCSNYNAAFLCRTECFLSVASSSNSSVCT